MKFFFNPFNWLPMAANTQSSGGGKAATSLTKAQQEAARIQSLFDDAEGPKSKKTAAEFENLFEASIKERDFKPGDVVKGTVDEVLSGDTPPARVTDSTTPGNYTGTFSDDHSAWVRSTSDLAGTMRLDVVSAEGETLGELRSVAEQPPFTPSVQLVTLDAPLSMRAAIVRPRDFKAGVKYPVIDAVYGGPGSNTVNASARGYLMQQWLADQGFIVVAIMAGARPGAGAPGSAPPSTTS